MKFKALSKEIWPDLEQLFGQRGACGGCWCMWWRLRNKDYIDNKGEKNKELFKALTDENKPLGVIAYDQNKPIGWCSISPRTDLIRFESSRIFKPLDEKPVWSISCMFLEKSYRKKGLSSSLIDAAVNFAFKNGAQTVESYPIVPNKKTTPDVFAFVGFYKSFINAGFEIASKASKTRVIMRKEKGNN